MPHAPAQFERLATIDTPFNAMTLRGSILALSDDMNETHVMNWQTREMAVLWGSNEPSQHNFQVRSLILPGQQFIHSTHSTTGA
jgi:hypothetical protein